MKWYGRSDDFGSNSKHTYMEPSMFKMMCKTSWKYASGLFVQQSCECLLCRVMECAIVVYLLLSKLSPFIFVKSDFRCHIAIQCEIFVLRFYLSSSSTLNVCNSQSQPKIRWMGLSDHEGFQWSVKQGNEPISRKTIGWTKNWKPVTVVSFTL